MTKKVAKRANSFDQHIALRLRDKRKEQGLSQTELADAVGAPSSRSRSTKTAGTASRRGGSGKLRISSGCRSTIFFKGFR